MVLATLTIIILRDSFVTGLSKLITGYRNRIHTTAIGVQKVITNIWSWLLVFSREMTVISPAFNWEQILLPLASIRCPCTCLVLATGTLLWYDGNLFRLQMGMGTTAHGVH